MKASKENYMGTDPILVPPRPITPKEADQLRQLIPQMAAKWVGIAQLTNKEE